MLVVSFLFWPLLRFSGFSFLLTERGRLVFLSESLRLMMLRWDSDVGLD
jgi:hypothetical protein